MSLLGRYADHPRAEMRALNQVALMFGANGPFYPLYVIWLTPEATRAALLTMLATPFFLAVPWIGRHWPALAGPMLVIVGLVNVLWSTALLGPHSGVGLFALPCLILAALAAGGRLERLGLLGLGLVVQQAAMRWPWPALSGLAAERQAALFLMNASSVGAFLAYLALVLAGFLRR